MTFTHEDLDLLFPPFNRDYFRAVCRLTRYLKHNRKLLLSHEQLAVADAIAAWIPHAVKHFTEEHAAGGVDHDDVYCIVSDQWGGAKWPLGFQPVAEAVAMAQSGSGIPDAPPRYGETATLLWRIMWSLNLLSLKAGEATFYVSTYDLARRINHPASMIHRIIRRMERDKLVTVATRGNTGEHGRHGKATVYQAF